jgi:hypothetical protein
VAELAREKVGQLEDQIAQLTLLRDSLKLTVRKWDRRLEKTAKCDRANLLESLSYEKRQQTVHAKGEAHENIAAYRVPGDSGFGLRSKRNVVPHARTASTGI